MPEGNGFWPAFWFWSGNNNLSYQEIDVFEFCGCDCEEYQAGFFYETDNNGIAGDDTKHTSSDIDLGNDACNNFNTYGVEWTSTHINFYLNGLLRQSYCNINNHNPMSIILNLAIGGCYGGCGWTYCSCGPLCWYWDTDRACHVTCGTEFPQVFEIDWIKGYQKENQAVYINGTNELCVGESFMFKAPNYPNATYDWSGTSGLQIDPLPWLNLDGGIWRAANIAAVSSGLQTLTLTVSFPSGYVETKTYNISVEDGVPQKPTDIVFVPDEIDCCYNLYTPVVPGATSYVWEINNSFSYTTLSNYYYGCMSWGDVVVSVVAQNSCGVSPIFSVTQDLPRLECWDDPLKLEVYPNPSSSFIILKFFNKWGEQIDEVNGNVFVTNEFGNVLLQEIIESGIVEIDVQCLEDGLYYIAFQNASSNLNTTFFKNAGY